MILKHFSHNYILYKKSLICVVLTAAIILFSHQVFAFDYSFFNSDTFDYLNEGEYDPNVPLIEFPEEYFYELNIVPRFKRILCELDEDDISIKSHREYIGGIIDPYEYYSDADILNGSVTQQRSYNLMYGNHLVKDPRLSLYETITIKKEAFSYLPNEFQEYLKTIDTLEKALEPYPHILYSENIEDIAMLCPRENSYEFKGEIISPIVELQGDLWVPQLIGDSGADVYAVYMTTPYTINVAYVKNAYYIDVDPDFGALWYTNISLNYTASDEDERVFELSEIKFDLIYDFPGGTWNLSEDEYAPQTGTPIVPLTITATAALVTTFIIMKKKRVKYTR